MSAAFAFAGLGACSRPPQQRIVPYLDDPENKVPGQPLFFATAMSLRGFGTGLLIRSNEGRPTKVEGNPSHSASLGSTSVFEQAAILQLYDPDRSRTILYQGEIRTWGHLLSALLAELERHQASGGRKLRILTEPITSPTLAWQLESMQKRFSQTRWHQWDPLSRFSVAEGCRLVLGELAEPEYQLEAADAIVSLDNDFLFEAPDRLRLTRAFAKRRKFDQEEFGKPNRLYVAEPSPSITGSMADLRLAASFREIENIALALAHLLVTNGPANRSLGAISKIWVEEVAQVLKANCGRSLVICGLRQRPQVHAWTHLINAALGNVGKTILYRRLAAARPEDHLQSLQRLSEDLDSGAADSVIILGGNPVYSAPVDLKFGEKLKRAKFSLHLNEYEDETSELCDWHVPELHFLESWSDTRAMDGTATVVQPLISPLYGGVSPHQMLALLMGNSNASDYDVVRQYWALHGRWDDFERQWTRALNDGVIPGTLTEQIAFRSMPDLGQPSPAFAPSSSDENVEIVFLPDPTLWDGRFANNGWLQELPKPFTKVAWDNPALISPRFAAELRVANGDVIEIRNANVRGEFPVWILPGQAERTIALHLSGGRSKTGQVGTGAGFNAYTLRLSKDLWAAQGIQVRKVSRRHGLVSTQLHHSLEGRDLLRVLSWQDFDEKRISKKEIQIPPADETFYNAGKLETAKNQWGMVVNLNACTGCNACVIACQSENNIPIVGKEQVGRGREMHWIRIDHYFEGAPENPRIYPQPVPCMHCETAPCELVCPVEATVHSADGLNQQVYNRCIGTRYCSNNCPYKVRRFNFLQYADAKKPNLQLMWNPQVTVRSRGVMEKCSYCVQRIRAGQIDAEKDDRPIRDGEVVPACAQACPADAIVFGDVRDSEARVAKQKRLTLNYAMLGELNTLPRTTYLAKVNAPQLNLRSSQKIGSEL